MTKRQLKSIKRLKKIKKRRSTKRNNSEHIKLWRMKKLAKLMAKKEQKKL